MKTVMIFVYLGLIFLAIYIYLTIRMLGELKKRGVHINFFLLRIYVIKYVGQYKRITTEEQGHPGDLYRPWLLSIISVAVCFGIAIVLKIMNGGL